MGLQGLSFEGQLKLVNGLKEYGKVLITSEGDLPEVLEPYRISVSPIYIHDLLNYASMYIGEGATMASESAILGTPSVYVSPLELGYLDELEEKYNLMYHFREGDADIEKVLSLAADSELKEKHQNRRQEMLDDKTDVTAWIVNFLESIT